MTTVPYYLARRLSGTLLQNVLNAVTSGSSAWLLRPFHLSDETLPFPGLATSGAQKKDHHFLTKKILPLCVLDCVRDMFTDSISGWNSYFNNNL